MSRHLLGRLQSCHACIPAACLPKSLDRCSRPAYRHNDRRCWSHTPSRASSASRRPRPILPRRSRARARRSPSSGFAGRGNRTLSHAGAIGGADRDGSRPRIGFVDRHEARGRRDREAGLILTNAHVVGDNREVAVIFKPQQEGDRIDPAKAVLGRVLKVDPVRDLALVEAASVPSNAKVMDFGAMSEVQVGADVHAIGHPSGQTWTYTKGIVSQIRRGYEWQPRPRRSMSPTSSRPRRRSIPGIGRAPDQRQRPVDRRQFLQAGRRRAQLCGIDRRGREVPQGGRGRRLRAEARERRPETLKAQGPV